MTAFCEVDLTPLRLSGLAVMCDVGGPDLVWLPLSQFETPPSKEDIGKSQTYELTQWICDEKELI